jgi:hypothetical protein
VQAPRLEKAAGAAQVASWWRWLRNRKPRAAPTIAAPVSAARRKICLQPIPHVGSGLPGDGRLHPHHLHTLQGGGGTYAGATGLHSRAPPRSPVPALTVLPLVRSLPCRDGRVPSHTARLLAPSERRGARQDAPWAGAAHHHRPRTRAASCEFCFPLQLGDAVSVDDSLLARSLNWKLYSSQRSFSSATIRSLVQFLCG